MACLEALDAVDRAVGIAAGAVVEAGRVADAQPGLTARLDGASGPVYESASFLATLDAPAERFRSAAADCR